MVISAYERLRLKDQEEFKVSPESIVMDSRPTWAMEWT